MGRNTDYRPEYCEMLMDHMEKGFSFESFAGVVGVNQDTLYEWAKPHVQPEFSEAKKLAYAKNLLWWEEQGMKGLWEDRVSGPGAMNTVFNTTNFIFQMKNRHRWRDRQDVSVVTPKKKVKEMSRREKIEAAKASIKFLESQEEQEKQKEEKLDSDLEVI